MNSPLLSVRYAEFTNVRYFRDNQQLYVQELWAHDLKGKLPFIKEYTLAAPIGKLLEKHGRIAALPAESSANIAHWEVLPGMDGMKKAIATLPVMVQRVWSIITWAEVVHVGAGGWPIPLSWIAAPLARMRRRFLVVVIESTPWFIPQNEEVAWKERLRNKLYKWMTTRICSMSDLLICTQKEYAEQFGKGASNRMISPATWVNEEIICPRDEAQKAWNEKAEKPEIVLAFVGRLTTPKGIRALMKAVDLLESEGTKFNLDIWGKGELAEECRGWAQRARQHIQVEMKGTLPYGKEFFHEIRKYTALLAPTISDEQPRIVYDAFSQAVPMIASATEGHKQCIQDGQTGALFAVGDAQALAKTISGCTGNRARYERMGMAALEESRQFTHSNMHRTRVIEMLRLLKDGAS